jgi:aspartate racemase
MALKTNFRLGVVGGLGIETSCALVSSINQEIRKRFSFQPQIVMENVSISEEAEKEIVTGNISEEMKQALCRVIKNLNKSDVDYIVLPCNSVHVFFNELQKISNKPILNILELCARRCKELGLKKVGILASQLTINQKLHQRELTKNKVRSVLPSEKTQSKINKAILLILSNEEEQARRLLEEGLSELQDLGAEAIILGCTDIQLAFNKTKSPALLIDTLEILEEEIINKIAGAMKGGEE